MKMISLHAKFVLAMVIITLMFACSPSDDNSLSTNPEPPVQPDPNPKSPLHITNGVVTGVDEGYSEIVFPKEVKRIQKEAFSYNTKIKKLTLNEGLEVIGEDAFFNSSIEEISFPSTLKEIEKYAFYHCKSLIKADLSRTKITSLPEGTFGYSELQSVSLPTSLTEIGSQVFLKTPKLTTIEIPLNVRSLGNEAFRESGLVSVRLPNNLSFLDQRVFYLCPNLQEVKTYGDIIVDDPNGSIEAYCFVLSPEIVTFEIPQNIRIIGQGVLNSQKVESITIPANVKQIEFSAFNNSGIKTVIVKPTTVPTARLASTKWYGFPENVTSIQVPAGTAEQYKAASGWNEFANKIQ